MMKRRILVALAATFTLLFALPAAAQSRRYDIELKDTPKPVLKVLRQYVKILRTSKNLEQCAKRFTAIAGGSLVDEDGKSLRSSVPRFSLKKDFGNVGHYADPVVITRVAKVRSSGSGYGPSKIRGPVYKIWIDKREGVAGMPAPIGILVPEGHKTIKTPKVTKIGSL